LQDTRVFVGEQKCPIPAGIETRLSIHRKSGKYAFNKEDNHTKMFLITVVITTHTVHIE
jgi:hypothetical protein